MNARLGVFLLALAAAGASDFAAGAAATTPAV